MGHEVVEVDHPDDFFLAIQYRQYGNGFCSFFHFFQGRVRVLVLQHELRSRVHDFLNRHSEHVFVCLQHPTNIIVGHQAQ